MSVAFRREGDDEHKEPKFELPIPAGPNLVTPRGLALTEAKVAELEAALAGLSGDAREAIARDLRYWRTRAATAEPVPPPVPGEAGIGSRVRLSLDGRERAIAIVGDDEAEPGAGRIAFSAPLARAVMGGSAGERMDFAGRTEAIRILEVTP